MTEQAHHFGVGPSDTDIADLCRGIVEQPVKGGACFF